MITVNTRRDYLDHIVKLEDPAVVQIWCHVPSDRGPHGYSRYGEVGIYYLPHGKHNWKDYRRLDAWNWPAPRSAHGHRLAVYRIHRDQVRQQFIDTIELIADATTVEEIETRLDVRRMEDLL